MINKMPGLGADKFANLRLAYTFFMFHPSLNYIYNYIITGDKEHQKFIPSSVIL